MVKKVSTAPSTDKTITVKQVRSTIANKPKTRGTMRALGLRKIGDSNTLPNTHGAYDTA